ncbi:cupredoxin domain-containing protein [Candidatus Nitrosotenuis uzonensis]|uniref:Blue (Type 1) copper domain protein n=1 Tax=Candidatus Nitrosotenuis uzonensis TaxID=1407055 RepID=V6AQU0_9ARCH|nr:hypothetical protein [Candidatus Nitrosotenuis uzonensis]CDI04949.1 membrane hypothetical protein [Candidatus Nitrosotenuis uzonensis]
MSNDDTKEKIEDVKNIENKFYEFLRDAQPLAFLASFSMIIAVFAFPNDRFNSVFEFAAIASAMFLVSFIVSLIGRIALFGESLEKSDRSTYTDLARYGTFFFFGIGIIYLILILLEFSKTISSSITSISIGWVPLFMGIAIFLSVRKGIKDSIKNDSLIRKLTSIVFIVTITLLLFDGVKNLTKGLTGIILIPDDISRVLSYSLFALFGAVVVLMGIQNKKTKGSFTNPDYKEGKTGQILNIVYVIIAFVFIVVIFMHTNATTNCDEKCKSYFENLGFLCTKENENIFSCRFVADKPITVIIPQDASISPNEKNFSPNQIVVSLEVNNTIRWVNLDKNNHKIMSDDNLFNSNELFSGDAFTYRFTKEGAYYYHGDLPWLSGKIIVKDIDVNYKKGKPLEQMTNEQNIFYLIFRTTDNWNPIQKLSILSKNSIMLNLQNQTEPQPMAIGDTIVVNCLIYEDHPIKANMTLMEINENKSYVIFKKIQRNTEFCDDGVTFVS